MPERLNGAVSKTVVARKGYRGFESHSLRLVNPSFTVRPIEGWFPHRGDGIQVLFSIIYPVLKAQNCQCTERSVRNICLAKKFNSKQIIYAIRPDGSPGSGRNEAGFCCFMSAIISARAS